MRNLAGKRIVVTGAASGIGRALALRLAAESAELILVDIDEAGLDRVSAEVAECGTRVGGEVADLASQCEIDRLAERLTSRWGGLDVLVNNAGIGCYGPSLRLSREQWERVLAVNFLAPVRLTHLLLPELLARAESHVVNVASMYGLFVTPRSLAYHTSKYGLVGFSEALRAEFSCFGLGVTAVCPGYVETALYDSVVCSNGKPAPRPPRWTTTTPDAVAARIVSGIRRNRRLVLSTPLAHVACYVSRMAPWLLDMIYRLEPKRRFRTPDRHVASTGESTGESRPEQPGLMADAA